MCRSLKRVWREWRVWRGEQWIFYMLIQTPWCSVTFKPGLHSLYSLPGQGCCCSSFMSFFTFLPESFHHLPWHVELLTRLSWGWLSSDLRVCLCGWRADKSLDVQSAAPQQKFPSWMLSGHSMDSKVLHSGSYPATCKGNRNRQSGPWGLQGITFWRPPSPLAHLLSTGTSPSLKGLVSLCSSSWGAEVVAGPPRLSPVPRAGETRAPQGRGWGGGDGQESISSSTNC